MASIASTESSPLELHAIIIGIEKYYPKSDIPNVLYAEKDALALSEALKNVGYDERNIIVYTNEEATRNNIEYEINAISKGADKNTRILVFFAGHGYTWQGKNYLMAYDSRKDAIERTAISQSVIYDDLAASKSRQVIFFLDCCHSGLSLGDTERGILEEMSHEELASYFENANFRALLSACDKGEKSFSSYVVQHGVWTYHLLKALRGEKPSLLDKNNRLLSHSLQDYLAISVPKQVSSEAADKRRSQRPRMYGDVAGTFVIADLNALFAAQHAARIRQETSLTDAKLLSTADDRISNLNDFRKGSHKVLPYVSRATRNFVIQISEKDLIADIRSYYDQIERSGFYDDDEEERRLDYYEPAEGSASIVTSDFTFNVTYSQSEEDPTKYVVTKELSGISGPDILVEDWFNKTFGDTFDTVRFEFTSKINLSDFVRKAKTIKDLSVRSNMERTECVLNYNSFPGSVAVTSSDVTFSFNRSHPPLQLSNHVGGMRALLLSEPSIAELMG